MAEIRKFRPDDLGHIVRLFNEHLADVPLTWPTTEEEFREQVIESRGQYDPALPFDPEGVFLAQEGGVPVGFVQACPWRREKETVGLIRCLAVGPGQREAAGGLVDAAVSFIRRQRLAVAAACWWEIGYPWYQAGDGACWETKEHLCEAFTAAGFRRVGAQYLMHARVADHYSPPMPEVGAEVQVSKRQESGTTFRVHEAHVEGLRAAEVEWFPCAERSRHPDARGAAYVYWVGTREQYRRRGIAAYLLGRALTRMRVEGITDVFLHTDRDNVAAQSVYRRLGLEVLGGCVSFWFGPGSPEW